MKPIEQGGIGISSVENLYAFKGETMKFFEWLDPADANGRIMHPKISTDLFAKSFAVLLGKSGMGKSYAGAVLVEQLIIHDFPVFIVDYTGEMRSVAEFFGPSKIKSIGEIRSGEEPYGNGKKKKMIPTTFGARDAEEFVKGRVSFYFDCSEHVEDMQLAKHYLYDFLSRLIVLKKEAYHTNPKLMRPHYCFFDEAHNFAPEEIPAEERSLDPPIPLMLNQKMVTVAKEMRKYGVPCCWLSQRARSCNKNVLAEVNVEILLPVDIDLDVKRYRSLLPSVPNLVPLMNEMGKHHGRCFFKVMRMGQEFPAPWYSAKIGAYRKSEDRAGTPGTAENRGYAYGKGSEIDKKVENFVDNEAE